jgi:hypothetical protein
MDKRQIGFVRGYGTHPGIKTLIQEIKKKG